MKNITKCLLLALGMSFVLFTGCPDIIQDEPDDNNQTNSSEDTTTDDNDNATDTNEDLIDDSITIDDFIKKSGTLSNNETWSGDEIYYVSNDLTIEATVTIEPGCIVKIREGKGITVRSGGKILATGNETNRIYFTSINDDRGGILPNSDNETEKQDWESIKIDETGTGCIFQFCTFEYGNRTLEISDGDVEITITDNIFENNYYGLCAKYGVTNSTIERNRFFSNTYPMLIDATIPLGNSNMFTSEDGKTDNTYQRITFYTFGNSLIDKDTTFEETELPFNGGYAGFKIYENITLTLKSGVVVTMSQGAPITIKYGGDFIMEDGSIITSTEDESLDGNGTVEADDYWDGIEDQNKSGSSSYTYRTNLTGVYFSKNSSK